MNNYCTNCGEKILKNELKCQKCNEPIVELPPGYKYVSTEKKNKIKKILKIVCLCLLIIFLIAFSYNKIKTSYLKNKYVKPYLESNNYENYRIKYEDHGKCIISGDCSYDPMMGCDGGLCTPYEYLNKNECNAYYFKVLNETDSFFVTVFRRGYKYEIVKGLSIYGEENELEGSEM